MYGGYYAGKLAQERLALAGPVPVILPEAGADFGRQTFAEWLAVNPRPAELAPTGRR